MKKLITKLICKEDFETYAHKIFKKGQVCYLFSNVRDMEFGIYESFGYYPDGGVYTITALWYLNERTKNDKSNKEEFLKYFYNEREYRKQKLMQLNENI